MSKPNCSYCGTLKAPACPHCGTGAVHLKSFHLLADFLAEEVSRMEAFAKKHPYPVWLCKRMQAQAQYARRLLEIMPPMTKGIRKLLRSKS